MEVFDNVSDVDSTSIVSGDTSKYSKGGTRRVEFKPDIHIIDADGSLASGSLKTTTTAPGRLTSRSAIRTRPDSEVDDAPISMEIPVRRRGEPDSEPPPATIGYSTSGGTTRPTTGADQPAPPKRRTSWSGKQTEVKPPSRSKLQIGFSLNAPQISDIEDEEEEFWNQASPKAAKKKPFINGDAGGELAKVGLSNLSTDGNFFNVKKSPPLSVSDSVVNGEISNSSKFDEDKKPSPVKTQIGTIKPIPAPATVEPEPQWVPVDVKNVADTTTTDVEGRLDVVATAVDSITSDQIFSGSDSTDSPLKPSPTHSSSSPLSKHSLDEGSPAQTRKSSSPTNRLSKETIADVPEKAAPRKPLPDNERPTDAPERTVTPSPVLESLDMVDTAESIDMVDTGNMVMKTNVASDILPLASTETSGSQDQQENRHIPPLSSAVSDITSDDPPTEFSSSQEQETPQAPPASTPSSAPKVEESLSSEPESSMDPSDTSKRDGRKPNIPAIERTAPSTKFSYIAAPLPPKDDEMTSLSSGFTPSVPAINWEEEEKKLHEKEGEPIMALAVTPVDAMDDADSAGNSSSVILPPQTRMTNAVANAVEPGDEANTRNNSRAGEAEDLENPTLPEQGSARSKQNGVVVLSSQNGCEHPVTPESASRRRRRRSNASTGKWIRVLFLVVIVTLLIGLIVAVAVFLVGERELANAPADVGGIVTATSPPTASIPTMTNPETPSPAPFSTGPFPTSPAPRPISLTLAPIPIPSPTEVPTGLPLLQYLIQVGRISCGVKEREGFAKLENGAWVGFEVDLCRAVAAGVFGDASKVDFVAVTETDRFTKLENGEIDLLAGMTTWTMEQEIVESSTGVGYSFTDPYLYNGMGFGGLMQSVFCADNAIGTGLCINSVVCVVDGTSYVEILQETFHWVTLLPLESIEAVYDAFVAGSCDLIAGDQFSIAPRFLEERAVDISYTTGTNLFSREPISLVTRKDEMAFSDVVNWILNGLLFAEKRNIFQVDADVLGASGIFGGQLPNAIENALSAVGNYAEIYQRHLDVIRPRQRVNMLNDGTTGRIFAQPTGSLEMVGPGSSTKLIEIQRRGRLNCGIRRRSFFADFDPAEAAWVGIDIEFCNAIAGSIFFGQFSGTVEYVDLAEANPFEALENGSVDLLSGVISISAERDVKESSTGLGYSFSAPMYYDGLAFGGQSPYPECVRGLEFSLSPCDATRICVDTEAPYYTTLAEAIPDTVIIPKLSLAEAYEGLMNGECNVIAGESLADLSSYEAQRNGYNGLLVRSPFIELYNYPVSLVTSESDPMWSSYVQWIANSVIMAEENGFDQERADFMPDVSLFGIAHSRAFADAVAAVGSYKEVYDRSLEEHLPRSGPNLLNSNPLGPMLYVFPGL